MYINMTTVDALTEFWNGKPVNHQSKAFDDLERIKSVPELKHLGDFASQHDWFIEQKNQRHNSLTSLMLWLWGQRPSSVPAVIPYYDPETDHIYFSVDVYKQDELRDAFRVAARSNAPCILDKGMFDVTVGCVIRYLSNGNPKPFEIPLDTPVKKEWPSPLSSTDDEN